jgi:hypothetical protein
LAKRLLKAAVNEAAEHISLQKAGTRESLREFPL